MRQWLAFGLPLVPAIFGCAVDAQELSPSDVAVNSCSDNSTCGGGECFQGVCRSATGEISALLVSVTPASTDPDLLSLTSYLSLPNDGTKLVTRSSNLDLRVQPAVKLHGSVSIDGCTPNWDAPNLDLAQQPPVDGAIPADVTFTPVQGALGIATNVYSAKAVDCDGSKADVAPYCFDLALPAGEYDVYVSPHYPLLADGSIPCVSPQLLLAQSVTSEFKIKLAAPGSLVIDVRWPLLGPYDPGVPVPIDTAPLYGWKLDIIDPNSGRVLSTVQTLTEPLPVTIGDSSVTYEQTLVYSPTYAPVKGMLEPSGVGKELIRLTPPAFDPRSDGLPYTAPVVLAELRGTLVNPEGKAAPARIALSAPLPAPVAVEFETALMDATPMAAGVRLTAMDLDGVDGLATSFTRTIQVDDTGLATVSLLPGRYQVVAAPKTACVGDSCLAVTETEWIVARSPATQGGKLIEFSPATRFNGTASVAGGGPAVGATVSAVPSLLSIESSVLKLANASAPILPRAGSGLVGQDGSFWFDADSGVFDLRVQPDPSTGFGWFVQPGVQFPAQSDVLDSVQLPLPVVYHGTASVAGSDPLMKIPNALIRAYAFLKPDGTLSSKPVSEGFAIEVAQAYSDDQGVFSLLVPKHLGGE